MPSTTNFGWTTPADTDLVKDGAAAIRTLGNGIDTSFLDLKGGTSGQVLAKNSNTDLDFVWVAQDDSNAIQNAIVDAKGDLISATAADTPARLAVGANGTVLTADSAEATGLKWAAPAGGGKVLQVVQGTYATETSSSSNTLADTGLSASITPSATSSKILAFYTINGGVDNGNLLNQGEYALIRGSTNVYKVFSVYTETALKKYHTISGAYLDSPATTSATTYKVQFRNNQGNFGTVYAQIGSATSTLILMEIGA